MMDRDAARLTRIEELKARRSRAITPKPSACVYCGSDELVCGGDRPVCREHTEIQIANRIKALEATVEKLTGAER